MTRQRGFTLLEAVSALVLVLITAGVLWSWADGSRQAVQDSFAETHLKSAATTQQAFASAWGTYTPLPEDLDTLTDGLSVTSGASLEPGVVSMVVSTEGDLGLATTTDSGSCIMAKVDDLLSGGSGMDKTWVEGPGSAVPCHGSSAIAPDSPIGAVSVKG